MRFGYVDEDRNQCLPRRRGPARPEAGDERRQRLVVEAAGPIEESLHLPDEAPTLRRVRISEERAQGGRECSRAK